MQALIEKSTTREKPATVRKARKSAEERKHDHYLRLAILLRQGRLHRMPEGITRASFEVPGIGHVDLYRSSTYAGYGYMVTYGTQGYECGCEHYEHKHSCPHTQDANTRAKARHQRACELAVATAVAPLVLGESFAQDVEHHAEDDYGHLPGAETMISDDLDIDPERAKWLALPLAERQQRYREMYPDDFYCEVA